METHVLLGAEDALRAASRMKEAAHDMDVAVSALQSAHQRHEEQMRQIVAELSLLALFDRAREAPRG